MDLENPKRDDDEAKTAPLVPSNSVEEVEQPDKVTTPEPEEETSYEEPQSDVEPEQVPEPQAKSGFKQKLAKWKTAYIKHKKVSIPATIIALLLIVGAIPATRYPVLGLVIKKNFSVTVIDAKTNKPISSVDLVIGGKTAKTGQDGSVTFNKVSVGKYQLKATKKYYKDTSSSVLVSLSGGQATLKLDATGRQVTVRVSNKIDGNGVKDAQVSAAGTEVKTGDNGEAVIVLPADQDTQDATITKDGFNKQTAKVKVTESETVVAENNLSITPAGKVYFLSKRTGKINVMKSNLDGTNAETVLAATGSEDDGDTVLLASQDWKYLALKSKRASAAKPASLYLIDTTKGDKLTTMDEGDASFTMTGWSGHTFVYLVQRDKVQFWQPNKYSIKSFDAETNKLNVLDNTAGEGSGVGSYTGTDYKSEYFSSPILVGDTVNYAKTWNAGIYTADGSYLAGKQSGIYTVKVNGQDKKTLKSFEANKVSSIESKLYKPREVYYRVYGNLGGSDFYEVENGAVQTKGDLSGQFYGFYPTYLYDPSNKQTFWAEPRDGKNTLFVGDNEGDNGKTVAELSDYTVYGWFTDNYLLVSKNSSELYIMGVSGLLDTKNQKATGVPLKVTDYHKPNTTFNGYGGGYGGL